MTNWVLHPGHGRRWPSSWRGALMRALQRGQWKVMVAGMAVSRGDARENDRRRVN